MPTFPVAASRVLSTLVALSLSPLAQGTDGFYDASWAGAGYFSFSGSFVQSGANSFATVARVEPNGDVVALGDIGSGGWGFYPVFTDGWVKRVNA